MLVHAARKQGQRVIGRAEVERATLAWLSGLVSFEAIVISRRLCCASLGAPAPASAPAIALAHAHTHKPPTNTFFKLMRVSALITKSLRVDWPE
jgi:hypothetical protein